MNESVKTRESAPRQSFCIILMHRAADRNVPFAWFTDSVSTGVNKIQAGNLRGRTGKENRWMVG